MFPPPNLQQDKGIVKEQHSLSPQWGDHHGDVLAVLQESVSRGAEYILVGICMWSQGCQVRRTQLQLMCPPQVQLDKSVQQREMISPSFPAPVLLQG